MNETLSYARRVACKMRCFDRDVVATAAARVEETYDPSRGVPKERWISLITRQEVWAHWRRIRRRRERQMSDQWWERIVCYDEPVSDIDLPQEDWQLLCEKHILGWAIDVIARRRGVTVYRIRIMLEEAANRLQEAYNADKHR